MHWRPFIRRSSSWTDVHSQNVYFFQLPSNSIRRRTAATRLFGPSATLFPFIDFSTVRAVVDGLFDALDSVRRHVVGHAGTDAPTKEHEWQPVFPLPHLQPASPSVVRHATLPSLDAFGFTIRGLFCLELLGKVVDGLFDALDSVRRHVVGHAGTDAPTKEQLGSSDRPQPCSRS
jgi:hypothetical protein